MLVTEDWENRNENNLLSITLVVDGRKLNVADFLFPRNLPAEVGSADSERGPGRRVADKLKVAAGKLDDLLAGGGAGRQFVQGEEGVEAGGGAQRRHRNPLTFPHQCVLLV